MRRAPGPTSWTAGLRRLRSSRSVSQSGRQSGSDGVPDWVVEDGSACRMPLCDTLCCCQMSSLCVWAPLTACRQSRPTGLQSQCCPTS
jgi:hypothetical protein